MPRLLKDLQINDVSSVDVGAGRGVRVMLMKRDFSAADRKDSAKDGTAMPDGSFPIKSEEDLHNAIRLAGNAKDPAKAQAHIKARAEAMGMSSALPDTWTKRDDNVIDMTGLLRPGVKKDAVDFDAAQEMAESRETAGDLICEINEAISALSDAVGSILCDETVVDKVGAINESFDQFKTHLEGLSPEALEKTMPATMTAEQITKAIDEAVKKVAAPLQAEVAKLNLENAVLAMPAEEQDFAKAMTPEQKAVFAAKNKAERAKQMEDAKKAAVVAIDPAIQKRLDQADEDRKVVKALVEKDEIATFSKRAIERGQPEAFGETLRKAAKGDAESFKTVEETVKTLGKQVEAAQRAAGIFNEIGKNNAGGTGATAYDQLISKRDEFRKTAEGAKLTPEQCFDKVLTDPANAELAKQEKSERLTKMGVAA